MRLLTAITLSGSLLALSACAGLGGSNTGSASGSATASTNSSVATQSQTQQFIAAVESKRGTALTAAEKIQLQGLAGATKLGLNNAQSGFLDKIGAQVGLDGTVVAALFPQAGKPVSESSVVSKLESKLGKKLTSADQAAVKAATSLRNNSVGGLKSTLASNIGSRIGMDASVVESLLPLLGF
ncbi:hypothetical protein [Amnimonas aquatica]|uniref:DUF4197 domain-containing protein n=1 Tax=Amnimonas aquatica TaxID=2094561 RepID=A0A2P6ATA8_9GAMM|nr:hypothetical protein [Amnimonas aquatica]PQA46757.1 hypothetical protein C5O18_04220 [Amnimonas aquatica]